MPPKKKKDDIDAKTEKKTGKKFLSGPPVPELLNEQSSKDHYLVQIKDLESRIERYQNICDELEVRNSEFRQQFDQLEDNKKDIVAFIKKKLDEKIEEISDLSERLVGLQQAKDHDHDMFEQQLQQLRTEYRETKEQLTSENTVLAGKLASLEEFRIQREELMSQTAKLEAMLVDQENAHREEVYNLEKKQVIDKDKLKKEMILRVNQVAAEFRKASNRQMAETTKRTIRENVVISSQLSKMSNKTMELITSNDDLKELDRHQRQEIELYQNIEEELTKKNISNQKIINMLLEKCKALELALEDSSIVEEEHAAAQAEAEELRRQLEASREEMTSLSRRNQQLEQQLAASHGELNERVRTRTSLEQVLENAAEALRDVVTPMGSRETGESMAEIVSKRSNMLEALLNVLTSAADIGVGPSNTDLKNTSDLDSSRWLKKRSVAERGLTSRQAQPHYQLGDLGFVPRPGQVIPSSNKIRDQGDRPLSTGTLQTVSGRQSSTLDVGVIKAKFFSDSKPRQTQAVRSAEQFRSSTNGRVLPAIGNSLIPSRKSFTGRIH